MCGRERESVRERECERERGCVCIICLCVENVYELVNFFD